MEARGDDNDDDGDDDDERKAVEDKSDSETEGGTKV